jgi:hypothetical protein
MVRHTQLNVTDMKTLKYLLVYLMPFFMGLSVACFKSCQGTHKLAKAEPTSLTKTVATMQAAVR